MGVADQHFGICALCLQQALLRFSHIVPEFSYATMYDEKHRAIAFPPDAPDKLEYAQKGLRSYLLCDSCEGFLNTNYEQPFKKLWLDGTPLANMDTQRGTILRVDYLLFKLFHLSVLWRASASTHKSFRQVQIGPHSETIRRMLWAKKPGPAWQYPIVCEAMTGVDDTHVHYDLFVSPVKFKLDGHVGYQFTFCGCRWLYIVSSHRMHRAEHFGLKESGELPVGARPVREILRAIAAGVQANNR